MPKYCAPPQTGGPKRYELRSSQEGIELAAWERAVREAGGYDRHAAIKGPVRTVTFMHEDPVSVRAFVRVRLGTENFSIARRWRYERERKTSRPLPA